MRLVVSKYKNSKLLTTRALAYASKMLFACVSSTRHAITSTHVLCISIFAFFLLRVVSDFNFNPNSYMFCVKYRAD